MKGDYPEQSPGLRCDNACDYMMQNTRNPAHRVVPGQSDNEVHAYRNGGQNDAQVKYLQAQL